MSCKDVPGSEFSIERQEDETYAIYTTISGRKCSLGPSQKSEAKFYCETELNYVWIKPGLSSLEPGRLYIYIFFLTKNTARHICHINTLSQPSLTLKNKITKCRAMEVQTDSKIFYL